MRKKLDNIDLTLAQRKEVMALLKRYLPDTEVWAYGSRVNFTAKPSSDLDMVSFASKEQSQAVANLREAFEESCLPFRVDLFVWDDLPKEFHKNIQEARVVVQEAKEEGKLQQGWQETTIGDVLTLQRGFDLPLKNRKIGQVPVIASTGAVGYHNEHKVDGPGVVIGRSGSIGGAQFILDKFWPLNTTLWVKDFKGNDARYCYYLIKSIDLSTYNVGSGVPTLNRNHVHPHPVLLAPLNEQKAIAHILGSLDDKIELNRRMNETLEAMAQALFKSWFVDFDPVIDNALAAGNKIPDEFKEKAAIRQGLGDKRKSLPDDIRRLFPSEFEYTEQMGWIPKEWQVSTISDEFDVIMGQSPPSSTYNEEDEGIPFFQGSSDFSFRYSRKRIYCSAPKRVAEKNYSLVSVRAPVGDVNMALEKCCIGRGLAALIHKSSSRSFTYYSMLKFKNNFKSFDSDGTVFGSITKKDFKSLKCIRFNYLLIKEFEKIIGCFDEKIRVLYESIIMLKSLRDTILFKLLSGEIRIEQAERILDNLTTNGEVNGKG